MRVCYTLWNHDYCIIKCFLGHKFLHSTKTHTHGSSLQCVNTQFNSIQSFKFLKTLSYMWTYSYRCAGHGTWMDTMCEGNYDCIQPHNDVLMSTRGQEWESSEQNSALAVKTIMKQGQQWQWKQQCPQQQKQNSALIMKAKLWNRGENNSIHNDAALSLWRPNSITMVTRALKTAVFTTTWHSHFEDKIMKHWWQQHWKQQCSQQTQPSHFWGQNYETPVTTRSAAHFNYEIMKH